MTPCAHPNGASCRSRRDRVQPGPTILIGEGNAAVHLVDVGSRMEPIGMLELPSEAESEEPTVDFPQPETPMTTITAGTGGEAPSVDRASMAINPHLLLPRRGP
jgi:hypothetical protein